MEIKPYKEKSNWEDFLENTFEFRGVILFAVGFIILIVLGFMPR